MKAHQSRRWGGFALLFLLLVCSSRSTLAVPSPAVARPVPADALVVANGTVIDGTGADPIPSGIVVVQRERIVAVGRAADFVVPAGARVVDAAGGTILPGIINAHTHSTANPIVRRADFLLRGVTSVCNLGSSLPAMPTFELEAPLGPVARGFCSGPMVTAPGGFPGPYYHQSLNFDVETPDEARAAVAHLLSQGADFIKIPLERGSPKYPLPVLDLPRVQAIVQEAHARGVLVRAHIGNPLLPPLALDGGVDTLEHLPNPRSLGLSASFVRLHRPLLLQGYRIALSRAVRQGIVMVPTLDVFVGQCYERINVSEDEKTWCDLCVEIVRQFHDLGASWPWGTISACPSLSRACRSRR